MGLNHIYKVIWSKTKNAWVVVSEIAKRDGKSSVKSVVTSLAGKSVAAVMVSMVICGGVASAATGTQYGTGATATYNDSVAVGENAQATNSGVTLVGANSKIQGQYSSVVGFNNKDYGVYGTSPTTNQILGSTNNVKGQHNTIVGSGITISSEGNESTISSDSMGSYNVALGDFQRIGGDRNVSILSDGYILRGKQNVSIGYGSKVIGASTDPNFSTAIGGAMARGDNTVGIGAGAVADNLNKSDTSIAIGTGANASDSIAIGANSGDSLSAQGHSVNIGLRNAQAINKAVILGSNNGYSGGTIVYSDGGVVIGHDNVVRIVKNGIIMGSGNDINGESQIAIGTNIQSNTHLGGVKGAVAIGYNSEFATLNKPSGTLNINGVNLDASNYAGNSSSLTYGNTFSIGKLNNERQLKNVAAGEISATSTDAVNGSQLYEAVRAVTAGASPDVYVHVNDGLSTLGAGNAITNFGKLNEKGGATGSGAIAIGIHTQANGDFSISLGHGAVNKSNNSIAIGTRNSLIPSNDPMVGNNSLESVSIGFDSIIQDNSSGSVALGPNISVQGTGSVAIGKESNVNGEYSVAINSKVGNKFSITPEFVSRNSVGINAIVKGDNNIAIGGSIGFSSESNVYDATSLSGFTKPTTNSIGIGYGNLVTRSNTVMVGSHDLLYKKSSDKNNVITPSEHKVYHNSGTIDTNYYEGTLSNSIYLGHESYAFTPDALVDDESHLTGEQSIHTKKYDATGNVVVSNNTTGGAFGKVSKATINGDEITGFAGAQSVGAVTIGAGDYERRIQNVAAGEVSATSTDGINGSQLYAVANTLSKNMSSYMHINDGTGTQTVGNATTNYGYSGSQAGATGTKSIAGGVNAQAIGLTSVVLGADSKASGNSAIIIGKSSSSDAVSDFATIIGADNSVNNAIDSVVLGHNNSITGYTAGSSLHSNMSSIMGYDNRITDSERTVIMGSQGNVLQSAGAAAIGYSANITNSNHGIAIGENVIVNNATDGIAIGVQADVSGQSSIAIGSGAKASGEKSISIGTLNEVKGNKSSAIGDPSYIDTTATGTHVHGNDNGTATNPIKASESTFMGNTNLAGTAGTTGIHVVGNNNSVDSSNVMVMGNNVTVGTGLDGAVVLGHASTANPYAAATDSTINGVTFEAAGYAGNTGLNNGSIVSVGATGAERQIKNVAAGAVTATSTDAINGSQLYKTAETILKMPINMAGDSGDTVGLKLGKTVNIKGSVASGADVTDGNIAVVGDKATSTLSLKMAKNLTGLTSGTFTDATGNQTVINGAGVTVTPTGTGATPISITTSGINAGNQEIKGVKKGTTDDAAVNKKQMDDALAGISSTLTINDGTTDGSVNIKTGKLKVVGESGTNALVTTTVSGDTITVGTSTKLQDAVTAAENAADKDLSNLSATGSDTVKTLAQDAVKVAGTGLATVSDATATGVKTYTVNVDEGKLVIDDTTGKIGAAGASQGTVQGKDGVATTQNVASVVNSAIDKTKQALDDAKHNFAGDDATVISRKHGEQLNIKGGASTTASDLTSGNIAVVGDTTSGTLNIKMAKALTGLTSATYTDGSGNTQTVTGGSSTISDAAGNSTVVSKGGVTTTDAAGNTTTTAPTGVTVTPTGAGATPISVTTSGISAGNKEIKNVANGTTDDAAVNKKQMDDALKGATDNTVSLGSESGSTTAKKLSTTGGIKFNIKGETGANALITTSATGDDVTIAPTAKLTAAVTAAEKSADKDLSNLSAAGDTYIKNLAKSAASWKVETNGAGTTAVAGGDTVNFIDGDNIAITNTGRSITIGTAKNVSFDKVTVGGVVIDKTDGINAGGKEIKGVATGTATDSAVNKGQMDAAITAAASGSLSTEKVVAKTLTGDNNLATVTGQTGTAKGETYEVSVSENAVKAVAATAAQDAVKVAGTGLATVSDATAAGVKTYTVNVDEGKLVIDDTTGKLGAAGASQGATQGKNGVATTQDVASVVNSAIDKTKQALDDAKHNFAGDDATVISRKHGEQLNIKGGASTTATDLTSGNIAVVGDTTSGTLNIKLAKALTGLTSATYTDAAGNTQTVTGGSSTITDGAGNTTTITKGGVTTTDGTNTTTVAPSGITATDGTHTVTLGGSGINAGGTEIKNIGKATTDDAAVNKKQMDDAVKAATDSVSTLGDNKVSLGSDAGTTTAKKLSTTGGIKFNIKGDTGTNALITTSATGDDVTIAPTAKLSAAVTAAENAANKDLSNLNAAGDTYIKNLAKSAASWNVETNGAGTTAVAGGDTVNFINGDNIAVTNTGRSITIGTAKNVAFDKVTVGGVVLDKTDGINAGGKEIKGIANGTTADAAVNKGQLDAAVLAAAGGSLSTEKVVAKALTGDTNLVTVTGQTGTAKGETYEVAVSENAVKAVAQTAAQDAVKVTGTGLATVTDSTTGGVKTYNVNVDEGKLVIDDTTGKLGATGATQGTTAGKNGVATTQDVATVVNSAIDKTKQALDDAEHKFDGDTGTTSVRKHGEVLSIKGGVATPTDLTTGNIGVVSDGAGTLNIRLAKALTGLTSATYTDAAGNTQTVTGGSSTITDGAGHSTVVSKGGVTTTDGTNTTTVAPSGITATDGTHTVTLGGSGINAGGTEIKNIGKATTDDAAVNKKQMDDAVKAATDSVSTLGDNKVSLGSDAGTTTAKKLSTTGGIKFNIKGDTGTNALITTSATGDDVTIAPTAKLTAAVTAAEKSADKDLSNISTAGKTMIKNLAATSAQDAVKVTGTGLATVTDSTTGGVKTYNVDVTTGNLVVTATGQVGAAGTTGAGGTSGTNGVATTQNVASAINDAITKSNANTAQALADAEHKFDGDTGTTSIRKHGEVLSIKGGVTTPADLTTGNLGVVSDGAGTLNIRLAKVLSGLTSASFTTAGGDTTMINGGGVTITPSATGATPISITTAGINAGNKEIKGIANGTTADAAVNKGQLDAAVLAAAGGSLSTEKVVAKALTGDTNLVTVTGQTGTAKGETYEVAVSENAVKAVAQTAAQDAVKVTGTGLATVTDSTTGGVKTYNVDVTTGNLVVTATGQVGAAGTTGAGGTSGTNGVATTQNVASAINDAITKSNANTAQALADAEHKFDGDTGTTSVRKHGEVLSIKGGVTNTSDLTTGNIGVVSDGAGTLNVRLAKTLTGLTSASFTDGTHTVTIGGSGINAGGTEIKNIGKATTDDAAVNKKQMDDAVKAATDSVSTLGDNKVSLGSDAGTTTAKKLSTTGGIKFNIKGDTGTNALITTSATGDDVTIAPTAKLSAAVTAAENAANKDLSNLSAAGDTYIKNLAKTAASWNVETNGTGTTAVAGGDTVNFINGDNIAITNTGRSITIGTAKNVSFDKVTVGGVVIDKNTGIDAGGKEITNVGPATSGNSAVNKTQMDTAITNAVNKATTDAKHDFGGDDATVVTRKHGEKLNIKGGASTTAADLTSGNIAVLGDAATGTLNIRMAKALTGLSSATFTTPSGTTVINGGGMTITPSTTGAAPISITTGGINAGNTEIKNVAAGTTPNSAVNKQQMDSAISNATANVGFSTAGNTGTGSVSNGQTLTITGTNGIETNASGQSITVGLDAATRAQINNATTTANNAAKKDLSNIDNAGKQMIKDTAAWNVKVNSAAAETVKGGDTVTFNDGDNIKVTNTGKNITIATKKDVSFDKVTVGNVVIDKNTNRISGLANAVNNDEAVNLGQMNAAISTVTAGANTIKYKANGGTQNSVALTTGFDFKGDSNIQITADPANSGIVNYKLNPALTGITSISGGTGAPTITLNAGSGSNPGNVSINSNLDMGGKQINNIGAATHAGDAVNKAQMDQALQNIAGASSNVAKSYAYKAGAGAAALAALKPIQYDPLEPTQIMAGIGNYKSQTAVALGVAHYTNENTMFNFGVSLDSHDGIVNAGVTHKFGYSPEKKAIPDRYKGGPISSIYVMQDEVTALQAIVQKQAAENEALRQQNEDMQRKVDMILSKIH